MVTPVFTYVSTWQGFVYVAFIIDVFAGYIVTGSFKPSGLFPPALQK
ncbi:hypothetical protein [Escherichia coli]|nr:hypothetical protein [Escherichia coli]